VIGESGIYFLCPKNPLEKKTIKAPGESQIGGRKDKALSILIDEFKTKAESGRRRPLSKQAAGLTIRPATIYAFFTRGEENRPDVADPASGWRRTNKEKPRCF
jgi:hypothetical protein